MGVIRWVSYIFDIVGCPAHYTLAAIVANDSDSDDDAKHNNYDDSNCDACNIVCWLTISLCILIVVWVLVRVVGVLPCLKLKTEVYHATEHHNCDYFFLHFKPYLSIIV